MITDSLVAAEAADHTERIRSGGSGRLRGNAVLAIAACAAAALPLSACGSGGSASSQAVVTKTCQQVSAVLSDGPDPSEDPVGYAEAQILPLRQVHTSDPALRSAIGTLADAYFKFFASDGKSPAAISAVTVAAARMNKLCPGAGATA
jgi:hypothetical protein